MKGSQDRKGVRGSGEVVELEIPEGSKNYSQNTRQGDPESQEMLVRVGYMTHDIERVRVTCSSRSCP